MTKMNIDQLYSGMAKAEINGRGTYLGEGHFEVQTKSIFVKKGVNPKKPGDSFICEFEIQKSDNADHPVGSTGSYVLKFSNVYAMGNIAELIIALLGYENTKANQGDADIREQAALVARAVCGSETAKAELETLRKGLGDPAFGNVVGQRLRLETTKRPTEAGGEYTVHKWAPLTSS